MQVYDGAVDRGLEGVIACTTGISSIVDATLCYRGFTIEQLAENSSFEETVFLLWNDRLPTQSELTEFKATLGKEAALESDLVDALKKLPTNVHPMAWLRTAISTMGLWDADADKEATDLEANQRKAIRLTAKMGTMVATYTRLRDGKDVVTPNPEKSTAWNFLYMLRGEEPSDEMVKVFDTCLVLHADHELNCSAFSTRVVASSLSDMHSAIVSGIGALKGPLHGGANERVMRTLKEIGSEENITPWLEKALAEKRKIMGFGHRVYKNYDPRAKVLQQTCHDVLDELGIKDEPLLELAMELERIALEDEYFVSKKLFPNVDFYSGIIFRAMGIPTSMFTVLFAMARTVGWVAQWNEMIEDPSQKIGRPRQLYTGEVERAYVPLHQRK